MSGCSSVPCSPQSGCSLSLEPGLSFHKSCSRFWFTSFAAKAWTRLQALGAASLISSKTCESKSWTRFMKSESRPQDQTLGCSSKLRGSRLSIIHTSSAWTRSLEKSWTRFRAPGSCSKIHHDYKEAKLNIKIPRLQGGKNLSIVNGLAGPLTLAASFCSA